MTNLRKDLELIEVQYENEGKKAVLTFLDTENTQVLEVNFNRQVYDNGTFVDDEEKAQKVDEWCEQYFETTFEGLKDCLGVRKDIYQYDSFNSLWESTETKRFDVKQKGKIFETEIKRIEDDGKGIHIYYDYEGDEYETKMMYSDYIETRQEWFLNPQKKLKQYEKFERKFGVPIEDFEELIGKKIMVEIKIAFGKFAYGEIKDLQ